jgi:hypothetical protein
VNVVAVDAAATWIMGFDPARVIYLQVAADAGLGIAKPSRLRFLVPGEGGLARAPDPERLRAARPFRVFTGVPAYDTHVRDAARKE